MKKLPYNYYFLPVLLLCLAGSADTIYLAISHYRNYTDIAYSSFCAISQAINCDTVEQSSWSVLFGIPVALWGLAGYLLYLGILLPLRNAAEDLLPLWSILQVLGLVFSLTAIVFGYISAEKIHSYCLMCILSYGISLLLFFYPWFVRTRFCEGNLEPSLKKAFLLFGRSRYLKLWLSLLVAGVLYVQFFLPQYWVLQVPTNFSHAETGVTEDGHPWIGSEGAGLTIEEFSDYQCFQCGKLHYYLRKLVEKYPKNIKLVHYNFPLDGRYNPLLQGKPYHIGSGELALLGIYASTQREFWEINDYLYKFVQTRHSEYLDLNTLANNLSLPLHDLQAALHSGVFLTQLRMDIQKGLTLKITATPAYVINGQVYIGSIPPSVLKGELP